MSTPPAAEALGWAGLATAIAGVAAYVVVVLRQPELIRMLNGAGLLLTSLALGQGRGMIAAAEGAQAFPVQAAVALLILAVIAQAAAALRNRRAWDGVERRRTAAWDGSDRRSRRGIGEDHA